MHSQKATMRHKDCILLPTWHTGQEVAEEVQKHHEAQAERETESVEGQLTSLGSRKPAQGIAEWVGWWLLY